MKLSCLKNVKRDKTGKRPELNKIKEPKNEILNFLFNNLYEKKNENCNCGLITWCGICARKKYRRNRVIERNPFK